MSPRGRTLCLLSARNLGDAVIHASFLKELVAAGYAERYVVWTFPQAAFLFRNVERCTVVVSSFPMGATVGAFVRRGPASCLRALREIRRMRPTHALELVADFRERWLCRLMGARQRLSIEWEPGHPFRRHIRADPLMRTGDGLVTVPASTPNVYAAMALALQSMLGPGTCGAALQPAARRGEAPLRIGVHPFASIACKLWPERAWIELLRALRERYPAAGLVLFGAPNERRAAESIRDQSGIVADVSVGTLEEFKGHLSEIDLLIGLDSFSVHLAASLGIRAIVLVGPNDPRVFTPPSATAVSKLGACPHQPCGGKPRCIGTDYQYHCMTSISVQDVLATLPSARATGSP